MNNNSTKTRYACGIPDGEQFIITGGVTGDTTGPGGVSNGRNIDNVHVYDTNGWVRDLPSLNIARSDHACASFMANGERVQKPKLLLGQIKYCSFFLSLEAGVHSIRPPPMRRKSSLRPRPAGGPSLLGCLSLSMFQKQSALTIKSSFW